MSDDSRPICKYSPQCYQKNAEHLKKYKHLPPPPTSTFKIFDFASKNKKRKIDDVEKTANPEDTVTNVEKSTKLDIEPNKTDIEKSPKPDDDSSHSTNKTSDVEISKYEDVVNKPETKSRKSKSPRKSDTPNKSPRVDHKAASLTTIFHEIPDDVPAFITEKFLVTMPKDFYSFWDYYSKTTKAADYMKLLNLNLVGPFDILTGKLPVRSNKKDYLLHWRYFFDPPEFQTILMSSNSEYHIGYYRDSPSETPCFVANNNGTCKIQPMAENIFGALVSYITQKQNEISVFFRSDVDNFMKDLKQIANENDFILDTNTPSMKKRQRSVVARTFHEAGIVVPKDKSGIGYRPLIEKNDDIKKILKQLVDAKTDAEKDTARSLLQPIITMANIATDECDFGTGLELGIDFFAYGEPILHKSINCLLGVAYDMLDREEFAEIIKVHLENRRKGSKLSIANLD